METVTLLPIADVGPNDGSASPPAPHYQNLDDEPNDGDGTFVTLSFAGTREVYMLDTSNIPEGSTVLAFRIRWAAKTGASLAQGRVGIRLDGIYYFAPERILLSGYPAFDETVTHPDGQPWTKERIAVAFAALELFSIEDDTMLPRPRFSELVGMADIIPPPERPRANAGRASHVGSPSASTPRATLLRSIAVAAPSSMSPSARTRSAVPTAGPASASPHAAAARGAIRAVTVEDLPALKVRVFSTSPRATVASSAPASRLSTTPPKTTEVE